MNLLKSLTSLEIKLDAMQLRERLFVLALILVACYFIWDLFIYSPQVNKAKSYQSQLKTLNDTTNKIKAENQKVITEATFYLGSDLKKEHDALLKQQTELTQQLQVLQSGGMTTEELSNLLEDIFSQSNDLKLITISNVKHKLTYTSSSSPNKTENRSNILGLSLTMKFKGNYFATLEFLKRLEASQKKIYWDALNYQVGNYPAATITMVIHTLNTGA